MRIVAIVLSLLLATVAQASSNDAGWRSDLDVLTRELPARHKNAFFHTSPESFEAAAERLDADIPALSDHQVFVRMMQLVAMIGDAHTTLSGTNRLVTFPVRLYWFADGIHVIAAARAEQDLLGMRLVAIDGHPVAEVATALAAVIPHENDAWLQSRVPAFMVTPEVLHALAMASSPGSATFTFEGPPGAFMDRTLVAIAAGSNVDWAELPDPGTTTLPLYRRNPELNYWYEYLPGHRAVYLKYNRCREIPEKPFSLVGQELGALVDAGLVDRVVLDMRDNGGGSSAVLQPLIIGIQSFPYLNLPDRFFVVIGRGTFSSAMLNAIQLQQQTNATLVGEPTGGKPNSYGEVLTFVLPWSSLTVSYSSKFFQMLPGEDPPSVFPELSIPMSSSDYFSARDPVLDTLLPPPPRKRRVRR